MNPPNSKKRFVRRNLAITAAAVTAVVLAGSAAVGLNLGILNAADDDKVGDLAAAGDLVPAETQVVDVYLNDSAASSTTAVAGSTPSGVSQEFVIDAAGTASVIDTAGGLVLGDVHTNPGWTWSIDPSDASTLKVSFTNGARTLLFTATLGPDGAISAVVEQSTPSQVATTSPTVAHDDHEGDDQGEEHEGREDDD